MHKYADIEHTYYSTVSRVFMDDWSSPGMLVKNLLFATVRVPADYVC